MDIEEPFNKAEVQFDEGNFKESIQLYSLAIEKEPNNAHYISKRGVAFFRIGKNAEALYDLDLALKLEPNNPYRYSSRAFILSNLNRIDEAISDYEKAVHIDPEDSIAYNNLGLLQEKKGYNQTAEGNFKKADDIAGIKSKHSSQNTANSPLPKVQNKKENPNYKDLGYWQFIKQILMNKKLRKEFFMFIRNGFK